MQYEILDTSSKYVKEGGQLVYSTCTLSRKENDEVVKRFLKEHSEFAPAPLWEDFVRFNGDTSLTVLPEYFNSDGFFIAKFIRL